MEPLPAEMVKMTFWLFLVKSKLKIMTFDLNFPKGVLAALIIQGATATESPTRFVINY